MIATYFLFAFASPIALFAYVAMALFAVFVSGKGQKRKFNGSWFSVIIIAIVIYSASLPLFIAAAGDRFMASDAAYEAALKYEREAVTEEQKANAARGLEWVENARKRSSTEFLPFWLALPTSTALLICYICVSRVPVGQHRGRSALDAAAGGLASVDANVTQTKYDLIDVDTGQKVGEKTETDIGRGCMGLFILAVITGLFAPFFVCFNFVVYQLLPYLTEQKAA